METLALWVTIAFLLTHELDAVLRHEWRIHPLTSFFSDRTGEQVFIWAHVPLSVLLIWIAKLGPDSYAAYLLSCVAIVHIFLHWLFRNHPANEFDNLSSRVLIWLTGLAGAWHLILVF
ncbi:MAG: hypothetical protein GY945_10525 [Rhodobacteraceae bacterium]|nr:hypothetical protein [Paracoccaceae bacterium]